MTQLVLPSGRFARRLRQLGLGFLGVAAVVGLSASGVVSEIGHRITTTTASPAGPYSDVDLRPRVEVVTPRRAQPTSMLSLPGSIEAVLETPIYARTNGYLKRWLVDIGDQVQEGQLLAEIDTPEIDQELKQAEATLVQSRANLTLAIAKFDLARVDLRRVEDLVNRNVSTRQEYLEQQATYRVAEASVDVAKADIVAKEADVARLREMQSFKKVMAPFAGIITQRNIDLGTLISSGSAAGSRGLFRLAQTEKVRTFLDVPQTSVPDVKVGQEVELLVREYQDRVFRGTITRTAGALDPATRTLRTEIHVDNRDNALLPGMYVQAQLTLKRESLPLIVPASTLLIDAVGTRVAVVDPAGSLHYQAIQLGLDHGKEVEIISGLSGSERLVVNPGDTLPEGARVQVADGDLKELSATNVAIARPGKPRG